MTSLRNNSIPRQPYQSGNVGRIATFFLLSSLVLGTAFPQDMVSPNQTGSPFRESAYPIHDTRDYSHAPVNDPISHDARHRRLGDPLVSTSWLNRPIYAGWMFGGLWGDELIKGRIDQDEDIFGGYRLGWDWHPYWGLEGRFAFAHLDFKDQLDIAIDRTCEHQYWDVDLLFYPWGDSRWRPYASVGVGLLALDIRDAADQDLSETLLTVPLGAGVKYYWKHWLALRVSVTDNLALANGPFDTMHNLSLTGDVEIRFGGQRMSYFPYHGSIHLW